MLLPGGREIFTVYVSAIRCVHDSCCMGGLVQWLIVGGAYCCRIVCVTMALTIIYYSLVSDLSNSTILIVKSGIEVELFRDSN